ncbi:mCG64906, partial [Mus musculus]
KPPLYSSLVSACPEDWYAADESYLVFATGTNCCKEDQARPQRSISVQVKVLVPLHYSGFRSRLPSRRG